jgi:hypothetical protein
VANIPVEKIILRIAQAISNKALQYNSWKKNSWFDPKAPYILAINLADLRQVTELY